MHIQKVTEVTEELMQAIRRLIPQLAPGAPIPNRQELDALINSSTSTLLLARFPDAMGQIAGCLNLAIYPTPTGVRSIIEDLVVDERFHRRGLARALVTAAVEIARSAGANRISLTSNPRREAANLLYQHLGFQLRDTNCYSLQIH